jgi:hypothetical protein
MFTIIETATNESVKGVMGCELYPAPCEHLGHAAEPVLFDTYEQALVWADANLAEQAGNFAIVDTDEVI